MKFIVIGGKTQVFGLNNIRQDFPAGLCSCREVNAYYHRAGKFGLEATGVGLLIEQMLQVGGIKRIKNLSIVRCSR